MADSDTFDTILPAGTVITANGTTGALVLGNSDVDPDGITIAIDISAVSGTTPGIVFTAALAADGNYPPGSYGSGTSTSSLTATGRTTLTLPATVGAGGVIPRVYKVSWVVSGTSPSFTVGVYGE